MSSLCQNCNNCERKEKQNERKKINDRRSVLGQKKRVTSASNLDHSFTTFLWTWLCCSPWLFNFRLLTHIFSDITKWGNNRSLSGGQIMFIYRHHLSWWVIVPFILIRGTSSKLHERAHKRGLLLTLYKPLHRAHVLNNLHAHHNSCLFNVWPSIRPHLSVPHTHRLHRPGKKNTNTHIHVCHDT